MEEDINFGELLRELQPDFLNGLNENINEFRKFFDRLAEEQDNSLAIEKIYRIAHNLRGNGASYGFPIISEIGERMEEALKPIYHCQGRMDETVLHFLADCINDLEKSVQEYREQQT